MRRRWPRWPWRQPHPPACRCARHSWKTTLHWSGSRTRNRTWPATASSGVPPRPTSGKARKTWAMSRKRRSSYRKITISLASRRSTRMATSALPPTRRRCVNPSGDACRQFCQEAVDLGNHGCSLAHGGRHALGGTGAHVADGEDAGHTGFQRGPFRQVVVAGVAGADAGAAFLARDVKARADKTLFIDGHGAAVQPVRVRIGADEQEDAAHRVIVFLARLVVAPAHARQAIVIAFECDDFRVRVYGDIGRGGDALDQIARHAGRQAGAAYHHMHTAGVAGKKDCRLASRVAAAYQHDFLLLAQLGLDR